MDAAIKEIAKRMLETQSFNFKNFNEARNKIEIFNKSVDYDRLTLTIYNHNLSKMEYHDLGISIKEFFKMEKEQNKMRNEYISLLNYFILGNIDGVELIEKCECPDFVVHNGNNIIGIEVTKLTSEMSAVLDSISKENFGKQKDVAKVKEDAKSKHGIKSENYTYYSNQNGILYSIGSPLVNIDAYKELYADIIIKKCNKYESRASNYDEFVILADGLQSFGVFNRYDVLDILNMVKKNNYQCKYKIVVLYSDENATPNCFEEII